MTVGDWTTGGTFNNAGVPFVFAGYSRFLQDTTVEVGAGTIFKFQTDGINFGHLTVSGTSEQSVVFTSLKDDSVGGDTNGDGPSTGSVGEWFWVHPESSISASHMEIRYCVEGLYLYYTPSVSVSDSVFRNCWRGITIEMGLPGNISRCHFADNSEFGVYYINEIGGSPSLTGCSFERNGVPVRIEPNCWPSLSGLTVSNDHLTHNGIDVAGGDWTTGGTFNNAGIPFVFGNYTRFLQDTTVAAGAGTIFKFQFDGINFGHLVINGTSDQPVVFTSLKDDSAGGDTNGDGPSTGSMVDWNRVHPESSISASHMEIRYCVEGLYLYYTPSVSVSDSAFTNCYNGITVEAGLSGSISGCHFADNSQSGVWYQNEIGGSPSLTGCSFEKNRVPIRIEPNCWPVLSGLSASKDHIVHNGIDLAGGDWTTGGTFYEPGIPYVLANQTTFGTGAQVTAKKGTVFKFSAGASGTFSGLLCEGTEGQGVTFTSISDDHVGGDTDGNGPSVGFRGEWVGILLHNSGEYRFEGAEISYASTGIDIQGFEGYFERLRTLDCQTGIHFGAGASGAVRHCDFMNNATGVSVDSTAIPNLGDTGDSDPKHDGFNQFICNDMHIVSASPSTIKAEQDWWGASPPEPSRISGAVDYDPFLGSHYREILHDVKVKHANGKRDLALSWRNVRRNCGYHVLRATSVRGEFQDISGLVMTNEYVDAGAGEQPGQYYYLIGVE